MRSGPETASVSPDVTPEDGVDGADDAGLERLERENERAKVAARDAAWERVDLMRRTGRLQEVTIVQTIKSGCLIRIEGLRGFVPYALLGNAIVSEPDLDARANRGEFGEEPFPYLINKTITVRVMEVAKSERRVVCSCTAAERDILSDVLYVGQVLDGLVRSIHRFGAFVEVQAPSGQQGQVFVPTSEISWDWVSDVNKYLTLGQQVKVMVQIVAPPPKTKLVASLRALQQDPLKETLDHVMPLNSRFNNYVRFGSGVGMSQGLQPLLDALMEEEGVDKVELGRETSELQTVSQDLELWMTRRPVPGGFNLVARAGRDVQEIRVTTGLSVDAMRAAIQRVLARLG
ncbi:hypothetical protein APUTEX25_001015, partial [Auxenochlorella protothecoides]